MPARSSPRFQILVLVGLLFASACKKKAAEQVPTTSTSASASGSNGSSPETMDPKAAAAEGFRLYDQKPNDYKGSKKFFEPSCKAGNVDGCAGLGFVYVWDEKDYAKGLPLVDSACTSGHMRACSVLGKMHLNGWGTTKDVAKAEAAFKKSCDGNDARGCEMLGLLYSAGDAPPAYRKVTEGLALLDKACKAGREDSCKKAASIGKDSAARAKVTKKYWDDDPDEQCTGKGYPPYKWSYSGGTYAEDEMIATGDGCTKLHRTEEIQDYCCPQKP